jgi:predicted nucleic acid-binding protein
MLRVVADANVLISAALARSPNAPSVLILEAALDGRLELVTSPQLLGELTSVPIRPRLRKYLSPDEALRFGADLAAQTILLTDPPGPPAAATPTTTTWSRSRPPTTRTRSSPAIPTCTQSTPSNSASRS